MDLHMDRARRSAKSSWHHIRQFFWPARSLISQKKLLRDGGLSVKEFANLVFLYGQGCQRCAIPMDVQLGPDAECGACTSRPPSWDSGRAALAYDGVSSKVVLGLKHAGRRDGLKLICNWMSQAGEDVLQRTDWLIPVPLHYQRLARRGYNQAAWLAQGIAQQSGTLVLVDGLRRQRPTPSQAGLTARQRKDNVAGAFSVRQSRASRIKGATITLVDDVFTTGATLEACTKALKAAGATQVNILVLARVVRETDITI